MQTSVCFRELSKANKYLFSTVVEGKPGVCFREVSKANKYSFREVSKQRFVNFISVSFHVIVMLF